MQTTIALLGMAAAVYAAPQASALAPSAAAPSGCSTSYSGSFEIQAVNTTIVSKRSAPVAKRDACGGAGTLVITINNGALTDAQGRVGEIVANHQFQFDPTPQSGAIYTSGFSVCNNGSLALGGSAVFYQCLSGGFYNLYDQSTGAQCSPILLDIIPCTAGASSSDPVGQSTDGQPTGTSVGVVSQKTDGQPTGTSVGVISQKSDGQPTGTSVGVVSQKTDGQPTETGAASKPASQISDGQVQVPSAVPLSQISDGQIQVVTAVPISQISDGQIQATTAAPKPTSATGVISQISDGQIQASTASPAVVSEKSEGQPVATSAAGNATSTPLQVTSSGNGLETLGSQLAAVVAGLVAVAFL